MKIKRSPFLSRRPLVVGAAVFGAGRAGAGAFCAMALNWNVSARIGRRMRRMFMVMAAMRLLFPAQVNDEKHNASGHGGGDQKKDGDDDHFPCAEQPDGEKRRERSMHSAVRAWCFTDQGGKSNACNQ